MSYDVQLGSSFHDKIHRYVTELGLPFTENLLARMERDLTQRQNPELSVRNIQAPVRARVYNFNLFHAEQGTLRFMVWFNDTESPGTRIILDIDFRLIQA